MKDFPFFEFKELKEVIRTILNSTTDSIIARYDNGEMQKSKRLLDSTIEKILCKCEDDNTTVIAVPSAYGFSSKYIKGFLSERFSYKRVLLLKELHVSPTKIKGFIRIRFGITAISDSKKVHLIIACLKHLIRYFNGHVRRWDIINSPEYIQYKEDNKEEKDYIRDNTKISCHIFYPDQLSPTTLTETPKDIMRKLRGTKCRIVYAQLENPFIYGFKGISYPKLIIIGLAQNNYALAEKGLFPDFVRPIEELYSADNRVLQKIAAVEYIRNTMPIQELPVAFPRPIRDMTEKLTHFIDRYSRKNYHDYRFYDASKILKVVPEKKYDKTILALFHQVKKYQEIYYTIKNSYRYNVAFFWYFLMKAKKFRLDYDYYKCVKDDIKHITNLL